MTASLLERARAGEVLADLDIVDMHGHMGAFDFAIPRLGAADLVAAMDRTGVRQVLVSHMACMTGRVEAGNDEVLAAMRARPGRILGYVTVWPESAQAVEKETLRRLGEGFTGIKLHNANGFAYTEAAHEPALRLAHERRLPVLLHTWGRAEEFAQVRELAARFPGASLLLAHSGMTAPEEYARLARELPNVYLETCGSVMAGGVLDRLIAAAGAEKVVWGSDVYFLNQAHQLGKLLGARCSDEVKRQVLSANARRILGAILRS